MFILAKEKGGRDGRKEGGKEERKDRDEGRRKGRMTGGRKDKEEREEGKKDNSMSHQKGSN